MTLAEMLEKRARLVKELRESLDKASGEKRELSSEEKNTYDAKAAEVRSLGALIEEEKRAQELRGFESALPKPEQQSSSGGTDEQRRFNDYLLSGERRDISVGSGGGALAPQQFVEELIKQVAKSTPLLSMVRNIPLKGLGSLGIPYEKTDASDADWTQEVPSSETADSTYEFGKRELSANALVKLIKVSDKLLKTSALPVDSIVRGKLIEKISNAFEKGIVIGSGSGQPLGLYTASANGVTTARDVVGSNTTTAITADSFLETKMKVRAAYRSRGAWIMSTAVMLQALKLKDKNDQYIWRPGLIAGEPDRLLNQPVIESEFAPAVFVADAYVAVFGDLSNYWWALLNQIEITVLRELYAAKNQIGYKGLVYADGAPVLAEAFARMKLASA